MYSGDAEPSRPGPKADFPDSSLLRDPNLGRCRQERGDPLDRVGGGLSQQLIDRSDIRVLLVDDDPTIRKMLRLSLSMEGFAVSTSEDGVAALEVLRNDDIDVILLDIMMPLFSGLEVLEHLRKFGPASIPVIIVSAKSDDRDVWDGWARGAESYLTKPLDVDLLVSEIDRVVAPSRQRRAWALGLDREDCG